MLVDVLPPALEFELPPALEFEFPPALEFEFPPAFEFELPPALEFELPPPVDAELPPALDVGGDAVVVVSVLVCPGASPELPGGVSGTTVVATVSVFAT